MRRVVAVGSKTQRRLAAGGVVVTLAVSAALANAGGLDGQDGKTSPTAPARVEYNRDVRPILSDNCFACHGPDARQRKAKLRLDTPEGARAEYDGGTPVVPGKPEESTLVERVFSNDPTDVMPPPSSHKTLTDAQKATLRRWVEQGGAYQAHWAYLPPVRPPVPTLKDGSLVRNPVDAFIQSPLEVQGVKPSPEADRRTLIRRLALDLTGIPPTPEEVEAYVKDADPKAYENLVDRLLASPHYGERMAQPWLDVARYADTVGFHGDQNQNVWPYRDYVIQAFNANMPFDRFTREQLAGDLLPNPTPEQLTATCFNRLNMMTREGGAQPKEYLAKYTADRIRTVGMAWLGSTLNCSECHDHKFDPFTMKDFYSLGAFFADVKQWGVYADYGYTPNPDLPGWTNDHPWPPEAVVPSPALRRRIAELKDRIRAVAAASKPDPNAFRAWRNDAGAFLKDHPDGWETPIPEVKAGPATPKAPRTAAAKKKAAAAPKVKNRVIEPPLPEVEDDGRVVFAGNVATNDEVALAPSSRWVAAVKVELRPDPSHGGKVIRSGDRGTVRVALAAVGADGKARALAVRHAQADRYVPRFANGFDVLGVQTGWATDPNHAGDAHTAVFFLDRPVRLAEGETLRVRINDDPAGCVRVSTTPVAPADVRHPLVSDGLDRVATDDGVARLAYLRSTASDVAAFDQVKSLEAQILECRDGQWPVMVTERTDKPLTIRVLKRGNWMDESGEVCAPATPAFLPKGPGTGSRTLTRLDLANWLCSPENPLTARVVMNRLWKQFFGTGLTAQVDDLGAQGDPPSHPDLLDWLAVEFRDGGWDVKRMVKTLVMSHTYRQSSAPRPGLRERDPNNRWLASQNARRLDAEFVRDNALAIAGLLNPEVGGPPSHPYQPAGYYEGLQFPDREYRAETDARQFRRGVYMHWQRTFLHPMLANFDAPSREDCVALRTGANSPQQALTLLNDPEFVEAARVWAGRLLARPEADDAARIDRAYREALARPPRPAEVASLRAFLGRARDEYRQRPEDARALLRVGVAPEPGPARDAVEVAAWASACRVLLNLHETITRY